MILTCPNCSNKFQVPDTAIPITGRNVKCSACQHRWFATPASNNAQALNNVELDTVVNQISYDIQSHLDDLKSISGVNNTGNNIGAADDIASAIENAIAQGVEGGVEDGKSFNNQDATNIDPNAIFAAMNDVNLNAMQANNAMPQAQAQGNAIPLDGALNNVEQIVSNAQASLGEEQDAKFEEAAARRKAYAVNAAVQVEVAQKGSFLLFAISLVITIALVFVLGFLIASYYKDDLELEYKEVNAALTLDKDHGLRIQNIDSKLRVFDDKNKANSMEISISIALYNKNFTPAYLDKMRFGFFDTSMKNISYHVIEVGRTINPMQVNMVEGILNAIPSQTAYISVDFGENSQFIFRHFKDVEEYLK